MGKDCISLAKINGLRLTQGVMQRFLSKFIFNEFIDDRLRPN